MRFCLFAFIASGVACSQLPDTFDYIILGGGTAGLVLANRLSEDQTVSVAVVEAGASVEHNPNVTQIANFFVNLNTSIDWQYQSQPQRYTQGRTLTYHSGKALGGTSTINGATYIRAQEAQIDVWEQLGNTGWNWSSLWPYYKKSERFQPPTQQLVTRGAEYETRAHGRRGHVHVGWSDLLQNGSAHMILNETFQNLGIPYKKDQSDGDLYGFSVWPSTIISDIGIRADAARNYLYPILSRPNLHLMTQTLAEKLIWHDAEISNRTNAVASGVRVRSVNDGKARILTVNRDIIVSAGTLRSPLILESSGIGNPSILSTKGISTVVNLPSVGENLQDQPMISIAASARSNWTGYSPFVTNILASDLFGSKTSSVAASELAKIPVYASAIAVQAGNVISAKAVEKQLRIQADLIFNKSTPCAEVISVPNNNTMLMVMWLLLPFSRGNVHLSGTDATSLPVINPNFFQLEWDATAEAALANLARKALNTRPLSTFIGLEIVPNTTAVPIDAGTDDWLPWLKENYAPNYHPVGTCAMMSRELGGVVDPELRVYGTANVRVVDASVLPFQVDGHLTSTIYAVAERAADIIKSKTSLKRQDTALHLC